MYTTVSAIAVVVYFPFLKQSCVINNIEKERPRIKGLETREQNKRKRALSLSLCSLTSSSSKQTKTKEEREQKK
jgi:hypothetical protein